MCWGLALPRQAGITTFASMSSFSPWHSFCSFLSSRSPPTAAAERQLDNAPSAQPLVLVGIGHTLQVLDQRLHHEAQQGYQCLPNHLSFRLCTPLPLGCRKPQPAVHLQHSFTLHEVLLLPGFTSVSYDFGRPYVTQVHTSQQHTLENVRFRILRLGRSCQTPDS